MTTEPIHTMNSTPTLEHEHSLLQRLLALVADRARREREIETLHAGEVSGEQRQYHEVFQLLTSTYESEQATLQHGHDGRVSSTEARWQAETAAVQADYERTMEESDLRFDDETTHAKKEYDEATWLVSSLLDEDTEDSPLARLQAIQLGRVASRTELEVALKSLDGWYRQSIAFLQSCRLLGEPVPPQPCTLPTDAVGLHQKCVESVRQSEPLYHSLMSRLLPRLFQSFVPLVAFVVFTLLLFVVLRSTVDPAWLSPRLTRADRDWQFIAAGASAAISMIGLFLLHLVAGQRALPDFEKLLQLAVDGDFAYQRWTVVSQRELQLQEADLAHQHDVRQHKRDAALARAEERQRTRRQAAEQRHATEQRAAKSHFPARLAEIQRSHQQDRQQAEAQFEGAWRDSLLRREQDFRNLQGEFDKRVAVSRQVYQQSWINLMREWRATLDELGAESDALQTVLRQVCPDWSEVIRKLESPVAESPTNDLGLLSLGRIVADLEQIESGTSPDPRLKTDRTRFDLPILMPLAKQPSLVVRTNAATRVEATAVLQTAMLRYLTSLPAGKVRFTILDPVGLGANFASFMHLADIDEQLVTSRIWTEPPHIEKRLADLTEHMETVLQAYLRNEYPTLDDYNRQAGEVAEPYRVLVVANFPTNFTEVSLRRLLSIADGGVRCGVFLLVSVDESQPLPRGFSLTDLERHAIVLRLPAVATNASTQGSLLQELLGDTGATHVSEASAIAAAGVVVRTPSSGRRRPDDDSQTPTVIDTSLISPPHDDAPNSDRSLSTFRLDDADLSRWPLQIDPPPAAEEFGRIVRLAGEMARSVRRVEVPFERVMPAPEAYWTSSSRAGLDIPVGRAGATKLQHLRLGKGTSQHVLIAGKTGSGKSSLLHALITNAALHYTPDEVEFYLIDFKKGVEFKTYATQGLPHARVIAIESDREFGVSVLQRLDELLKQRGDLYRRAGVQDLAGYRDARPNESLPRVMLVIDEFQEFFIEEDVLSQQAALLLDRLIRQGRAFGVHVLLGSQTLAGAYSLARSTLGQIAVRIALQCSETDAHLILSEENSAARLLSRPGEAIYNDANGLVEGNHPFQVVWLDDSQRETYLGWLREWADEFSQRSAVDDEAVAATGSRWPDAIVFEGNVPADPLANPLWVESVRWFAQRTPTRSVSEDGFMAANDLKQDRDGERVGELGVGSSLLTLRVGVESFSKTSATRRCWLGDSVSLTGPLELRFGPREGTAVLVIGRDDEAALGVLATAVLALAGQDVVALAGQEGAAPTEAARARFIVLDGSLPNSAAHQTWQTIADISSSSQASTQPPSVTVVSPRETTATLTTLVEELHSRNGEAAAPLFVIVFDLARFRDLKKAEDDFGSYGGFDKQPTVNPAALWAEIIKDGPAAGIFPLVWCDGFQTAQRWLGRELLNRFETRVLFAMNANDSSNLIDTPAASKLGPNRALLSRGDLGTLEKFRPYSAPSRDWLLELPTASRAEMRLTEEDVEEFQTATMIDSEPESPASENDTPAVTSRNSIATSTTALTPAETAATESSATWTGIENLNVL